MANQKPRMVKAVRDARTGLSHDEIRRDFLDNLFFLQGKFPEVATINDWYLALAYTVRDRLMDRWVKSVHRYWDQKLRTVCYLSAEFLIGPQLGMGLLDLGIESVVREVLLEHALTLEDLIEQEEEPGLGSGGLGRLAACFMESLATLGVPALGYGIRYEFGIFDQEIRDGWQVEVADRWLRLGYPWEIAHPEISYEVKLGGSTEGYIDSHGQYRVNWIPSQVVRGTPFDTPVPGYRVGTANTLRLWKSEAVRSLDFEAYNAGEYYRAVEDRVSSENITKILYPNDEQLQGRELRLKQQYFCVSCSLQDMIRIHLQREPSLEKFSEKFAIQLNDTHPVLAVPELMRLLIDEYAMGWDAAWQVTQSTFAYTNHTLLPEALERWPVGLMRSVLPRHLEIIYELNRRFLDGIRESFPGDEERVRQLSLIDESGERFVRMAHLAALASHAINGVADLHTRLLGSDVLSPFHTLSPGKFSNKTNGVTPRRFLLLCNPRLAALITETIGENWVFRLEELRKLEPFAKDSSFQSKWREVKAANKRDLAGHILEVTGIPVNAASLFDVHVKRIHEYKRQHLNLLHVVALYNRIRSNPQIEVPSRTVIFSGKAAPGYFLAKLMIKLITAVGTTINGDERVRDRLKVVFIPDFNVKNAQRIYPAADLSEQISTAGKEASGTGNMKLVMNGAVTIGTLDGANIEIRDEVGADNFFLFGLTADGVARLFRKGYRPRAVYESNSELKAAIDAIATGDFSADDRDRFRPLTDSLIHHDPFAVLSDFQSYVDCQDRVSCAWMDSHQWTEMSILNVARSGKFSSDRAIREYCRDIWHIEIPSA
jgi:glycogen phosphorylase